MSYKVPCGTVPTNDITQKTLADAIAQQTRNSRDAYQMRTLQDITSETLTTPGLYLAQRKLSGPAASSK